MNYSQERKVSVQVDSHLAVGHIDDGHRPLASVARGGACGRARGEVGRRERRGHGGRSRQRHEFCDRPFFRDGVSSFVTDPFFGMGSRVL